MYMKKYNSKIRQQQLARICRDAGYYMRAFRDIDASDLADKAARVFLKIVELIQKALKVVGKGGEIVLLKILRAASWIGKALSRLKDNIPFIKKKSILSRIKDKISEGMDWVKENTLRSVGVAGSLAILFSHLWVYGEELVKTILYVYRKIK